MSGTLLPLPASPLFRELIDSWPDDWSWHRWPRTSWLRVFEDQLANFYPHASSRDLSLTARHYAPFPLSEGHDVP